MVDLNNYPNSLLKHADKVQISLNPFPHIIIKNPLDKSFYQKLQNEFPEDSLFCNEKEMKENARYNIRNTDLNEKITKTWSDFIEYHSSDIFFDQIINIFSDSIATLFPDFLKNYKDNLYQHGNSKSDFLANKINLCTDTEIAINSPLTKNISTVRSPHLDSPQKLYAGLFYMRNKFDESHGGDLKIYCFKNKNKIKYYGNDVPIKNLIEYSTVKYEENVLILLLNTPDSIHGVTERTPTQYSRRFVYFSTAVSDIIAYDTSNKQIGRIEEFALRVNRKFKSVVLGDTNK